MNRTLPSAVYSPVRSCTLGTLPDVIAESGSSSAWFWAPWFCTCTLLLSEAASIFGMTTVTNANAITTTAAAAATVTANGFTHRACCFATGADWSNAEVCAYMFCG